MLKIKMGYSDHRIRLPRSGHRPNFFAHLDCFGGSDISNELILGFAFSTSTLSPLGVFGDSSIFVKPLVDFLCTSFGNVDLLGVNAVATFRAELRIFLRTSHDRFFARYQRTEEATVCVNILFRTDNGRTHCQTRIQVL
jgi:hypothetical protein